MAAKKKTSAPKFVAPTADQIASYESVVHDFEVGTSAITMRTKMLVATFPENEDQLHVVVIDDKEYGDMRFLLGRGVPFTTAIDGLQDREHTMISLGVATDEETNEEDFTFYSTADEEWYFVSQGMTPEDFPDEIEEPEAHLDADGSMIIATFLMNLDEDHLTWIKRRVKHYEALAAKNAA